MHTYAHTHVRVMLRSARMDVKAFSVISFISVNNLRQRVILQGGSCAAAAVTWACTCRTPRGPCTISPSTVCPRRVRTRIPAGPSHLVPGNGVRTHVPRTIHQILPTHTQSHGTEDKQKAFINN